MKNTRQQQSIHKKWLLRLLTEISESAEVMQDIAFKGGTCASLLGYLDRFSVDLDFDLLKPELKNKIRTNLYQIFDKLGLIIDEESQIQLQFFLKYPSNPGERNTLKLEIIENSVQSNIYQDLYIQGIDRYIKCQNIQTMFANKLVALIDRYEKHSSITTRDVYDINHFFNQGFAYHAEIITERTQMSVKNFFEKLLKFIEKHISQKQIDEDLNYLLDPKQFLLARKFLKQEVINHIKDELSSL